MSSWKQKLVSLGRKSALAIPLGLAAYAMTRVSPLSFIVLVGVAGVMSHRELRGLVRRHGAHPLIRREQLFVSAGLLTAIVARFINLPLTLAIGLSAFANDIAASVGGMTIGKKYTWKGLSQHSPNKSWEGAATGFVVGTTTFCLLMGGVNWRTLVTGALASVAGIRGDLQESQMKRALDIKDVGTGLGAHGGWTDRIDNVVRAYLVGGPVYWLLGVIA